MGSSVFLTSTLHGGGWQGGDVQKGGRCRARIMSRGGGRVLHVVYGGLRRPLY